MVALDMRWFTRFSRIGSWQAYELLRPDSARLKEQKAEFLAGQIDAPRLHCPLLEEGFLSRIETELVALKNDILHEDVSDARMNVVRRLYLWKINEKLAEARMLLASLHGNMRRFHLYGVFVYGKVSSSDFASVIHRLQGILATAESSENEEQKEAAAALRGLIDFEHAGPCAYEALSESTISTVREITMQDFESLSGLSLGEAECDATQIQQVFTEALDALGVIDWHVVIKDDALAISVSPEACEIHIPPTRRVSGAKLQQLVFHEIGTHVLRFDRGARSSLLLLSLGFDRYESGEEGIATMREQLLEESFDDFAGFEKTLAIGLALGCSGAPRSFRQLYDIMRRVYLLEDFQKGRKNSNSEEKAWKVCLRVFRGTDCTTPGVCFLKDGMYRSGNERVWKLLEQHPEAAHTFSIGKFDPTNARHVTALRELGLL